MPLHYNGLDKIGQDEIVWLAQDMREAMTKENLWAKNANKANRSPSLCNNFKIGKLRVESSQAFEAAHACAASAVAKANDIYQEVETRWASLRLAMD